MGMVVCINLKAPVTTAAEDIHKYFFHCFSVKIRLDVSSESSASFARQRIHLKHQVLFSLKDKSKKLKCCLLQFLFGALRVKVQSSLDISNTDISKYSLISKNTIWTYFSFHLHFSS